MLIINESGLYHALFKSRKNEAQVFRKWVKNEVLPSIRQTGKYSQNPKTELIEPEVTHFITLTDNQLCELVWKWKAAYHMRKDIEEIEPALRLIKSEHAASFYSMAKEYIGIFNRVQKTLLRETLISKTNQGQILIGCVLLKH